MWGREKRGGDFMELINQWSLLEHFDEDLYLFGYRVSNGITKLGRV